jgi:hypothetical protein
MKYKYIEQFMGLVSQCPALEYHFNANEDISTSLASINAAMSYGSFSSSAFITGDVDPSSILCLVLGDGSSPRTALAAAIMNGWTVVAIDEKLDKSWLGRRDGLGNSHSAHRYVGFRGAMDEFIFEGKHIIQSSLCDAKDFQHLIIICIETTSSFDRLETLHGRCGVADLRMIYNNIPVTLVSVSSTNLTQCPFQSTQASSYLDNGILAANRHVKVWNFERPQRSFDNTIPTATVTISSSSEASSMTQYDAGSREVSQVSMTYTRSSKVAQLQLQEALAAIKNSEIRSKQRNPVTSPSVISSQETTTRHRRTKSADKPPQPKIKMSVGIRSPITFRKRMVEV